MDMAEVEEEEEAMAERGMEVMGTGVEDSEVSRVAKSVPGWLGPPPWSDTGEC